MGKQYFMGLNKRSLEREAESGKLNAQEMESLMTDDMAMALANKHAAHSSKQQSNWWERKPDAPSHKRSNSQQPTQKMSAE